jgi:hypothetical protein
LLVSAEQGRGLAHTAVSFVSPGRGDPDEALDPLVNPPAAPSQVQIQWARKLLKIKEKIGSGGLLPAL